MLSRLSPGMTRGTIMVPGARFICGVAVRFTLLMGLARLWRWFVVRLERRYKMGIMVCEDYVSFETAKLLKKKGFPQDFDEVLTVYPTRGSLKGRICDFRTFSFSPERNYGSISAPSLYVAQKWLREEKDVWVNVWAGCDDIEKSFWNTVYCEQVCYGEGGYISSNEGTYRHSTYEEALESGIAKALEII